MKYILGQKIEMSQKFNDQGKVIPVTMVKVQPCTVTCVKTIEKDGYNAVQIATGKKNKVNKPLAGHLRGLGNFRFLREFRDDQNNVKIGDMIQVDTFNVGDKVKATSISKGKGYQGVVKRHGFAGQSTSHGTKDQVRMPGSIGSVWPQHVLKGTRMAGRMGGERVTVSGLEIIEIDADNNLLYIKGAIPGHRNSLVCLKADGQLKIHDAKESVKVENKSTKEQITPDQMQQDVAADALSASETVEVEHEVKQDQTKE